MPEKIAEMLNIDESIIQEYIRRKVLKEQEE